MFLRSSCRLKGFGVNYGLFLSMELTDYLLLLSVEGRAESVYLELMLFLHFDEGLGAKKNGVEIWDSKEVLLNEKSGDGGE